LFKEINRELCTTILEEKSRAYFPSLTDGDG